MTKPGRARDQVSKLIKGGLNSPLVTDWIAKRRLADLPSFLSALATSGPSATLAHEQGARDAHAHLVAQWPTTVESLARPDSLPQVRERRERVRVHPLAPVATAATAAGGSVWITATEAAAPLEALGVVGVVAATAVVSAAWWRPRARPKDRTFTLSGTPALVARAQTELGDHGLLALTTGEDHLTRLVAAAAQLEEVEAEGVRLGLLTDAGAVHQPARTPGELALVRELLERRTELVHSLVTLGSAGLAARAQQRAEEREGYGQPPL